MLVEVSQSPKGRTIDGEGLVHLAFCEVVCELPTVPERANQDPDPLSGGASSPTLASAARQVPIDDLETAS